MRKFKRFGIPVLVVAALALVGAGFTNSLTFDSTVTNANQIGYGKVTVSTGASISGITYAYSNTSDTTISGATLTFDTPGVPDDEVIRVGWNGGAMTACTGTGDTGGTGDGTVDFTGATCTGLAQLVSGATDFDVEVAPN